MGSSHHHRQGSRGLDLQRQLMALSQSGSSAQHPPYAQQQQQSGSPSTFGQHHSSPNPFGSSVDQQPHHQQHQHQYPHPFTNTHHTQRAQHGHGDLHGAGMVHSAPAHVAFNIYNGPIANDGASNIPGLTLGPAGAPLSSSTGAGAGGHQNQHRQRLSLSESQRYQAMHPLTILDQDISPLTSPWLGAHPTSSHPNPSPTNLSHNQNQNANNSSASSSRHRAGSTTGTGAGSKRLASPSGEEGGSARKRQSPAIGPTLGGIGMRMSCIRAARTEGRVSECYLLQGRKTICSINSTLKGNFISKSVLGTTRSFPFI